MVSSSHTGSIMLVMVFSAKEFSRQQVMLCCVNRKAVESSLKEKTKELQKLKKDFNVFTRENSKLQEKVRVGQAVGGGGARLCVSQA